MTPESVIQIGQEAIKITVLMSAPILGSALAVGLLVGMFQAATQIQEMTLSFIPKIIGVVVVIILTMPWMLNTMHDFTEKVINMIPMFVQ